MTTPADNSMLLTVDDTAARLRISRNMVFKLLRSGDLASMTIGRKRLIPRQEIDRFIQERTGRRSARPAETAP